MENSLLFKRLYQLMLQDYQAYRAVETPEIISALRIELEEKCKQMEIEIVELDKEYRVLVNDKNSDTTHRMEVHGRTMSLKLEVENLWHLDDDSLLKLSRQRYSKTEQLQNSLKEQRKITDSLWGR